MNLQTTHSFSAPAFAPLTPVHGLSTMESVVLRHLRSQEEIASVLHLRSEIDLSVHHSADSNFAALEKKEMKSGLSLPSSWTEKQSARYASCLLDIN
jgi:hypothetical protein